MSEPNEETDMLHDHEERLGKLEKTQEEFSGQMEDMRGELENVKGELKDVKGGLTKVENTVMKGNMLTQELQKNSNEKVDRVFEILVDLISNKQNAETTVTVAKLTGKQKIIVGIFGSLFSAGGLLSIIQFLIDLNL